MTHDQMHDKCDHAYDAGVKRAREQAIHDCIAAVEREPWWSRKSNEDGMGGMVNGQAVSRPETFTHLLSRDSLIAALRALLTDAPHDDPCDCDDCCRAVQ